MVRLLPNNINEPIIYRNLRDNSPCPHVQIEHKQGCG